MFNSVGVICKPNDFTSQKTALELGVLLKDLGVGVLEGAKEINQERKHMLYIANTFKDRPPREIHEKY